MANTLNSTQARSSLMGTERIGKLLVQFAVPAILMNIVSSAYNMVDKIFVGNMVGDLGITATTVAHPAMRLMTAFAILVGAGGNALLALSLGEGKHKEAERIVNNTFLLIAAISITLTLLGEIFIHPLLTLLGCSEEAVPHALPYLRIVLLGGFFESVTSGLGMFIRTDGKPKYMMACTISGCLINIVLDPILIGVCGWGIAGAAVATVFAQIISGGLILYYFTLSSKSTLKLRLSLMRPSWDLTRRSTALGASNFISSLSGAITQTVMLASLGIYAVSALEGDLYIAAIGVTTSVGMLFLMPAIGMQQALQPILGYNYGAKNYDRVLKTVKYGLISIMVVSTVGWLVILLWAEQLCAIFGADPQYIHIYARTMRLYNILLPLFALSAVASNLAQAIGKPKPAILLSLTRQVFALLPSILLLPLLLGLEGILWSMAVTDFVSAALGVAILIRETRIIRQLLREMPAAE